MLTEMIELIKVLKSKIEEVEQIEFSLLKKQAVSGVLPSEEDIELERRAIKLKTYRRDLKFLSDTLMYNPDDDSSDVDDD
jgi:hypothetical protein